MASGINGSIVGIHGFLGSADDWRLVIPNGINYFCPDLFSDPQSAHSLYPPLPYTLPLLADWINVQAAVLKEPRTLVGYSLGGRIALHALLQAPHLWQNAIIISAHPGFTDTAAKQDRRIADQNWADRFRTELWESLIADWNNQRVFENSRVPPTSLHAEHFSRERLAQALEGCSLAEQADLRPSLAKLEIPLLWVVGENDPKFRGVAEDLIGSVDNPQIQVRVVADAGHRILVDQPAAIKHLINRL
jgi:2-succinyl-6-hydroxy-2,4-cyclohexadiene-1-carboxylate synthase